jgi:hypothetical protein
MTARQHSNGSLDQFDPVLVTPVIGNEFKKDTVNIVDDILNAPNADERIRDLAIMSMISDPNQKTKHLTSLQSLRGASSSFAPNTT